jgi:[ribosomal protein S5]-alanine N-acetyltransferase
MANDMPMIETRRLVLAPIALSDYRRLAAIAAVREIADTTISVPHPMTLSVARDWVEHQCESTRRGEAAVFTVRRRIARSKLGLVSLRDIDCEHGCAELSFWLATNAQGRGYASEATAALVHHGFSTLGLHRIEAYQLVRNAASARVLSRIGFQLEGTLRERVVKWGRREDANLWSKLRDDPPGVTAHSSIIGRSIGLAPVRSRCSGPVDGCPGSRR